MSQDDRHNPSLQDSPDSALQTALAPELSLSPWEPTLDPHGVTEAGSFSVESYADRLMDDLFADMEIALERGDTLSHEIVQPEPPVASSQQLQQLVLSALSQRRQAAVEQVEEERSGMSDLVAAAMDTPSPSAISAPSTSGFDRLLLGLGCLAITATGAFWWLKQTGGVSAPTTVAQSPAPASNAFGDYMQQAMRTIGAKSSGQTGSLPSPAPSASMSVVGVPLGTASPAASPSPTRVATGLSRLVPPAPLPRVATGGVVMGPAAPPAPGFMASSALPPSGSMAPLAPVHSLVGVMQLGDRSAALIEINGISQRVRLGESISSSGWTLVEVSKDQAVIRRNGEVRSILIGQTF